VTSGLITLPANIALILSFIMALIFGEKVFTDDL